MSQKKWTKQNNDKKKKKMKNKKQVNMGTVSKPSAQ